MLEGEEFDPVTGQAQRHDQGMKRWIRGYMKKPLWNTFDVLYSLGALATAGLGIWAAIEGMHQQFSSGNISPFTCKNPGG
jgi:hypothetical protein